VYEKAFKVEIITPGRVVYRDEATSVSAPGVQGRFQILYSHAPFLSAVEIGALKVKEKSGMDIVYATSGGFVEVKNNAVIVLVETAERSGEIDVARAEAARERAAKRLRSEYKEIDHERAQMALLRAMNRLRLAERR
jgi:F-type H+-transporting ATPase subunit epsilon